MISTKQKNAFAQNLRRIRQVRGLTQKQLAERMGDRDPTHVYAHEKQKRTPRWDMVLLYARALSCDPLELLGEN